MIAEFNLADKNGDQEDIFLDFQGEAIEELVINDEKIADEAVKFSKHKIYLPRYNLNSNSLNKVTVKFINKYVSNSAGFHRYQDPVDNEVYLYTHLEPFFCNRWFPCFDQPSIRAPLSMRVVTPDQHWQVVANDNITHIHALSSPSAKEVLDRENLMDSTKRLRIPDTGNLFIFEQCPPISSYIYALVAGPYCSF